LYKKATRATRGAAQRTLDIEKSGDVAARPRQVRDEARADRVGNNGEDNWDGARLL
jgi:hypothetical protein